MNRKYSLLVFGFLAFIQSLFGQKEYDVFLEKPKVTSFKEAKVEAEKIIISMLDSQVIPGMSLTISKAGTTIWQQGYGLSDIETKEPIDAKHTLFRIASVSKSLSAVGLGKMMEMNLVNINESIHEYVPYFPRKNYDFTLKQLGGHLAGIRNYKGSEFMNNKPLSIREGVALFEDDSLLFQPGTKFSYNSYNWNLLSLAMQEASGISHEEFMKLNVLEPLGMYNTYPDKADSTLHTAVFYTRTGKKGFRIARPVHNYYKLAGGGYLSTSDDSAKLGNALLAGNFLSKEIQEDLLTSQQINGEDTGYGIGFQSSEDWNLRPYYGHVGNGIGGYAYFFVYPEEELVFALLLNVTNPNVDIQLNRIIDYVIEGAKFLPGTKNSEKENTLNNVRRK